jgi:hypothetical protein
MTSYFGVASPAVVFAAGSIQWNWGLDDWGAPNLRPSVFNASAQQIAANVLARLASPPSGVVPKNTWVLKYVDSQETQCENGYAVNSFDGNPFTYWHTQWCPTSAGPPHEVQIYLGGAYNITGFRYLPRQDGSTHGWIGNYEFFVSSDGTNWTRATSGSFPATAAEKEVVFAPPLTGQYVRLVALSEVYGNPWTSMAELSILGVPAASGAAVSTLTIAPVAVVGGASAQGTVVLNAAAPSGGVAVTLASSNTNAAVVPATVTAPAGANSASFTISTSKAVATSTWLSISAVAGGVTQSVPLEVLSAALPFQQTDTADSAPRAAYCSGLSINMDTTGRQASYQGTPGTGTYGVQLSANAKNLAAYWNQILIPAGTAWNAGIWTISIDVTRGGSGVTLSSAYLCRVNSSNVNQATIGSATGLSIDMSTTGVKTFPIAGTAQTPASGDFVELVIGLSNSSSSTPLLYWQPNQVISSPFALSSAVVVSSLNLSPTTVTGGRSSTGTVTLSGAAPAGGAVMTLASSNTAVATVPASVTVAAGATGASFTVSTSPVSSTTSVTISGAYNGSSQTATLSVNPPSFSSLSLSPSSLAGGSSSTGTVVLSGAAAAGGAVVTLSSSNTAVAMVPASVTVAAGMTSASFAISTSAVSVSTMVTISASYNAATVTTSLTVQPASGAGSGVALQQTDTGDTAPRASDCSGLSMNGDTTGRLVVYQGTPGGASNPGVAMNPNANNLASFWNQIVIPAGVSWNGGTWTINIDVKQGASGVTLSSAYLCRVSSSNVNEATIGSTIGLNIDMSTIGVKTFTIAGSAQTPAAGDFVELVVGLSNSTSTSENLYWLPNQLIGSPFVQTLSSLTVNPTTVTGGSSSTGSITLAAAAPSPNGATVNLSSNSGAASVPASVTVPAGSTSANFTINTSSISVNVPVTISATYNNAILTTTLNVQTGSGGGGGTSMSFQQTDTGDTAPRTAYCSGLTLNTSDSTGRQDSYLGTLGTGTYGAQVDANANNRAGYWNQIVVPAGTAWNAGTWTINIDVTQGATGVTLTNAYLCRVSSSNVNEATIGSATGLNIDMSATGVKTLTIAGTAQTPAAGDFVELIVGFSNSTSSHPVVYWKPNQVINSPF